MLRMKSPSDIAIRAILDENQEAVKVIENCLQIRMIRYDEDPEPTIVVVCSRVSETGIYANTTSQFVFSGDEAADLLDEMQPFVDAVESRLASGRGTPPGNQPMDLALAPELGNHFEKIKEKLRKPK